MSELENHFLKIFLKNLKINVKMQHLNKKTLAIKKFRLYKKTRPRMTKNGLGKTFRKNLAPKNRENSKNQSELLHVKKNH